MSTEQVTRKYRDDATPGGFVGTFFPGRICRDIFSREDLSGHFGQTLFVTRSSHVIRGIIMSTEQVTYRDDATPYKRLLNAILTQAIEDILRTGPDSKVKIRNKREALMWLRSDRLDYPNSFCNICFLLELDPDATRDLVLKQLKKQHGASKPVPCHFCATDVYSVEQMSAVRFKPGTRNSASGVVYGCIECASTAYRRCDFCKSLWVPDCLAPVTNTANSVCVRCVKINPVWVSAFDAIKIVNCRYECLHSLMEKDKAGMAKFDGRVYYQRRYVSIYRDRERVPGKRRYRSWTDIMRARWGV